MRRNLAIFASIPVAAFLLFFAFSDQMSFSVAGPASELLSSSDHTTIKIAGDASQEITPDQITLILNLQTTPAALDATSTKSQELVQKLTDSINSALGPNQAKIQIGQTYLNPYYSGAASPSESATFSTYSSVQIKTDLEHYNDLSTRLAEGGFRLEGISIREVEVGTSPSNTQKISIPFGASTPTSPPYFDPESVTVKEGTTIVWTNDDSAAHTVTGGTVEDGPGGSFDSGLFKSGNTFEYTFNIEGEYPYFCLVHPWMTGTIIVTKSDVGNTTPKETAYQVTMNVIVETQPDTLKNSIKAYQEKFETLKQILDDSGVPSESIKSNQINFNQIYYGSPQYSTYNTNTRIVVNTDIKNAEKLLNSVKIVGVNAENIMFSVSDSTLDTIRKDLTQKALDDALQKAKEIAEPSGLTIKSIRSIEVNANPPSAPYSNVVAHRGVIVSPVYDGSIYQLGQLSVSVTAEFEASK